jgi:hypothetical protein
MVASATSITSEILALRQSEKKNTGPTLAEILSAHTEVEIAEDEDGETSVFASRKGTYDCVADVMSRMRQLMEVVSGGGYTLTLSSPATALDGEAQGEYTEVLEQQSDGTWRYSRTIRDQG